MRRENPSQIDDGREYGSRSFETADAPAALGRIENEVAILRQALDRRDFGLLESQNNSIDKQMGDYLASASSIDDPAERADSLCVFLSFVTSVKIISSNEIGERHGNDFSDGFYKRTIEAIGLLGETRTEGSLDFLRRFDARLDERFSEGDTHGQDFISVKWMEENLEGTDVGVFDGLSSEIIRAISQMNSEEARAWIKNKMQEPTEYLLSEDPQNIFELSGEEIGRGGEEYFEGLRESNYAYSHGENIFEFSRVSLLDAISEMETAHPAVDDIIDWLQTDGSSFYFREKTASVLNQLDAEYAKNKLLGVIAEPPNPHVRELSVNLLFRLELGEVPITEEGLNYLNQKYNLGIYNKKGNVARRLTADGTVGVFDEDRALAACFEAARSDSPEEIITPELGKVSVSDLFLPRANETDDERASRERALEIFAKNYFTVYRSKLFERTGFYFSDLTLKEQGAFLLLQERLGGEGKEFGRLMDFTKRRGEAAFRSLLALQYDPETYNVLVGISENASTLEAMELAEKFFQKISDITEAAQRVGEYLGKTYGRSEGDESRISVVTERLMQRAVGLIKEHDKKEQTIGPAEVRELELVKADILLFAAAFKEFSKDGQIDLADISETSLETMGAKTISREDREKMKDIFVGNRKSYSKELLQKTAEDFERSLEGNGEFYILRHGNEIVGYLRFEKTADDRSYAGSFNVSPEIKGFAIGSALLRQAIEREGQTKTFEAVVYEKNPMLRHYTGDFGFKIVGEIPDYEGTGEKFYKIERPPTLVRPQEELRAAA